MRGWKCGIKSPAVAEGIKRQEVKSVKTGLYLLLVCGEMHIKMSVRFSLGTDYTDFAD